jgi:hypothetical protein
MLAAALAVGWDAVRLTNWRVPAGLSQRDPVLYGEPIFADMVAGALGVALLQAPLAWLPWAEANINPMLALRNAICSDRWVEV